MAKKFDNSVHDALLAELATADILHVCSSEPANYAAIAAASLADVALTPSLGGGDWGAAAAGDVSGRKTTLAAQADIPVDATGTATHVVVADVGNTTLQAATTCTSQGLTSGNTVTVPAHDYESQTPT